MVEKKSLIFYQVGKKNIEEDERGELSTHARKLINGSLSKKTTPPPPLQLLLFHVYFYHPRFKMRLLFCWIFFTTNQNQPQQQQLLHRLIISSHQPCIQCHDDDVSLISENLNIFQSARHHHQLTTVFITKWRAQCAELWVFHVSSKF